MSALVGAVCLLFLVSSADAITVTGQLTGVNPGLNVSVHRADGSTIATRAGVYVFDLVSDDGWGKLTDPFPAFCIDLKQNVWGGPTFAWEVMDPESAPVPGPDGHPMDAGQHLALRQLYAQYYTGVTDPAASHIEAAAFQTAIWEIIWESSANGYDVDGGNALARGRIYANDGWAASARTNAMLGSLAGYSGDLPELRALVSTLYQDQIVLVPGHYEPPPVPEPITLAGAVMGLAGLATYLRRRRATA